MPYTKLVADSGSSTLSSGVKANARSLIVVKPSLSSNSVIVESEKGKSIDFDLFYSLKHFIFYFLFLMIIHVQILLLIFMELAILYKILLPSLVCCLLYNLFSSSVSFEYSNSLSSCFLV